MDGNGGLRARVVHPVDVRRRRWHVTNGTGTVKIGRGQPREGLAVGIDMVRAKSFVAGFFHDPVIDTEGAPCRMIVDRGTHARRPDHRHHRKAVVGAKKDRMAIVADLRLLALLGGQEIRLTQNTG